MTKLYYKAIFSDGTVLTRSTASRTYSHAWINRGTYTRDKERWEGEGLTGWWNQSGFCRTEALAYKSLGPRERSTSPGTVYTTNLYEVAPAIEITRQEYDAMDRQHAGSRWGEHGQAQE